MKTYSDVECYLRIVAIRLRSRSPRDGVPRGGKCRTHSSSSRGLTRDLRRTAQGVCNAQPNLPKLFIKLLYCYFPLRCVLLPSRLLSFPFNFNFHIISQSWQIFIDTKIRPFQYGAASKTQRLFLSNRTDTTFIQLNV